MELADPAEALFYEGDPENRPTTSRQPGAGTAGTTPSVVYRSSRGIVELARAV